MVAEQCIPTDEQDSVLAVLRKHPELRPLIARATRKAEALAPDVRVQLDTVGYDEWDPPLRLIVHMRLPWHDFREALHDFTAWLVQHPEFDQEMMLVMPMWAGPLESRT